MTSVLSARAVSALAIATPNRRVWTCGGSHKQQQQRRRHCLPPIHAAAASGNVAIPFDKKPAKVPPLAPLPTPPVEASLSTVIPYLWRLASGDSNLGWRLIVAVSFLFAGKAAGLAGPLFFKWGMDVLAQAPAKALSTQQVKFAVLALVFSALSKALSAGLNETRYLIFAPLGFATGRRVGVQLLEHVLGLDLSFHLERRTGALSRILDRAQRSVMSIFRAVVFTFVPTILELLLVCGLLAKQVSPIVAAVVVVTFTAYVAWTFYITQAAALSRKEVNKLDELASGKAVDALLNYETVVQFNNQKLEVMQYDALLQNYQNAALDSEKLVAALNAGQALIQAVGIAVVMGLAGFQVSQGIITVGDLVLANGLILQLSGPLQFLGFIYRELRQSLVDLESLFGILRRKPMLKDGTIDLPYNSKGLHLKAHDLQFSYSSRKVLHGVSFEVLPGQSLAIVGPSGSGKSTILKLLLRLYDPESGRLSFDGQDLRSITQASLRRAVAVVPQETVLFNDTISKNILYGRPSAKEEEVVNAAKQARLHDTVLQMPDLYNSAVGERGLKLSGGEKQRVAIARAFLKAPRLLVCDEATSALDSTTEAAILNSLKELATGRTCVFVAHRLSTIMHCDKILVLDAGVIVEQGTHHKLLEMKGMYSRMWALQESESQRKLVKQ
ncbi:ABC transporter B family member 23, mitochondrial [Selaginella moellendorffii]|uniref:ABC transporter B family member 23, mitochondrial n=1 Tax=Selaginella moellendorffii TaxID=88036 RepID=UPI000D1CFA32|nr:ABC transporter B family member 23, mitochondrial [Selaginella moellendorffii]|eukprot:XP_024541732.1 ABC transporter B family member 23, mitochondrial [Selaginella moellendorffii]